jgi:serine/threonine-protein kinase
VGQRISDRIRELLHQQVTVREQRAGTSNALAWTLVQRAERTRSAAEGARGDSAALNREFRIADSLLALAERQDAKWIEPVVLRALAAYRHAYLLPRDAFVIRPWIAEGLGHADRALARDPRNAAAALEVRGNLKYLSWLANVETDPARAHELLLAAETDLERATELDPARAGAWATLSHLYNQIPEKSGTDVNLAASKALAADAYLSNADVIMWRLFTSTYDLDQPDKANKTCADIRERFPNNVIAVRCQLFMLTTRIESPDLQKAWQFADSVVTLTAERRRPYQRLDANMFVAAVIARAAATNPSLADSARRLAKRSEGDAQIDVTRDLALRGAFVYAQLGDRKEAIRLLKLYLAVNQQRRQSYAQDAGWWLKSIENDPEFKRLVGSGGP